MKSCFRLGAVGLICLAMHTTVQAELPANTLSDSEKKSGWQLLFDGKTSDGWRNYKKDKVSDGWKVVDGAIVRTSKGAGDIITNKKYGAFELSLEYKISKGGNSGVMFHVVEGDGPPWRSGPEIQVQDNVDGHDPQLAGWLYQLYQPAAPRWVQNKATPDSTRPAGQWNELYIRIAPQQCEVCLNGVLYYRFKIGDGNWKKRVAKSKFAKYEGFGAAGSGHICLQDHNDEVSYRNIKLREIGDDGSVAQPIDGKLNLKTEKAFPNLKWDQWEAINENGRVRAMRMIELTYAKGDSRLFAISQQGGIWCFENKPDVTKSHMVLDLREAAKDWKKPGANEQGLLGLAMHPDFTTNGYFYVYYSSPDDKKSVISRFTIPKNSPNQADPDSEKVILEFSQPYKNHNGGSIEFGPDGFLYIGVGDGGDRNDPLASGQDLSNLLGSVLRIDVDNGADGKSYSVPSDNPFVNVQGAKPEIYAHGVRNPWRISFDKKTSDLWLGDVGQELWEEVNVIRKGGNYGWAGREGNHSFGNRADVKGVSAPIDPVWEYDHRIGKSITGGRMYYGNKVPELVGKYLYADYVTGRIWALTYDRATGKATRNEEATPQTAPVLAFGEDQNGEIYFLTESTKGLCINRFQSADPN